MKIQCPHCQIPLAATPEHYGLVVDCPECKGQLTVPHPRQKIPAEKNTVTQFDNKNNNKLNNIQCPHCQMLLAITPEHYGLVVDCPQCHGSLSIPHSPTAEKTKQSNKQIHPNNNDLSYIDIPSRLAQSIFLLICFWPSGIVALIFSIMTIHYKNKGEFEKAQLTSNKAQFWGWISLIAIIISLLFVAARGC